MCLSSVKSIVFSFLFFSLFIGCQTSKNKMEFESPKILEDVLKEKAKDPNDIVNWLKKCAISCESPDNQVAADMASGYEIMFSIAKTNPVYSQLTDEQKKVVLQGQDKIRKSFLKILSYKEGRDILETAYKELSSPQSLYTGLDSEVEETMKKAITRLRAKDQTKATSWYLQAQTIPAVVENLKSILQIYIECLKIDPKDTGCRQNYTEIVKFYERPRCESPHFDKNLAFDSAKETKDENNEVEIEIEKKKLFKSKTPILSNSDILEATFEFISANRFEIWFETKTFSNKKLEAFTGKVFKDKNNHYLLMNVDSEYLAGVLVKEKISDGQFRMIFNNEIEAHKAFEKMCNKLSFEKLPDNLRI